VPHNERIVIAFFVCSFFRTYDSLIVYSPVGLQTGSVSIDLTFKGNTVTTNLTFEYRPNPSIDLLQVAPIQLTR